MSSNNKDFTKIGAYLETLLLFLICLTISFSFGIRSLLEDNYNYAVEEMHAFNSKLFSSNINVVGAGCSPRFYANQIMAGLMNLLRFSWYEASAVLIRLNYLLYAFAATMISKKLSNEHKLFTGVIVTTCLMTETLISLAFGINGAPDVFLGTAIPVALIGLSFILDNKRNWLLAWIFASLAGYLHIHEGMWAGCVLGIIWLAECIDKKKIEKNDLIGIAIYIVSLFIIVAPSLVNTYSVDDNQFVNIYALIRTPHHLLLSAWGKTTIAKSASLIAGAWISALIYEKYRGKNFRRVSICSALMTILFAALLFIEQFATVIHPMSSIVTMYLPKCFKYITVLAAFLYISVGFEMFREKQYLGAIALLSIPLIPSDGYYYFLQIGMFSLFLISELTSLKKTFLNINNEKDIGVQIIVILLVLYFAYRKLGGGHFIIPAIFIGLIYDYFPKNIIKSLIHKYVLPLVSIVFLIYSMDGYLFRYSDGRVSYIDGEEFVKSGMGDNIYNIATDFREYTDEETVFLADPNSSMSNAFQLVSQKSCYVLYKNTPSNKNTIFEWYDRINHVSKMTTCKTFELKELMKDIDVDYVLITADRFEEVEQSGFFDTVLKNDEYAVCTIR